MKWVVAGALLIAATHLVTRAQTPSREQPPTFRSSADVVSVDVSVVSEGKAVSGLTAADFELLDNGVAQRVESVDRAAMPLDVTLLVDVSSHTSGVWDFEVPAHKTAAVLEEDVPAIAAILRPQDRIRLLTADTYIKQVAGMRSAAEPVPTGGAPMHGLPAVYDALVTAMLRRPEAGRRQLIVAWTKALDFISVADAEAVRDVARHSDAVVHIIERNLVVNTAIVPGVPGERLRRTWRQHVAQDLTVLSDVVALTGGTLHGVGVLADSGISEAFKDVFDDFRAGYVLRYAAQGVKREGWHDITVRVPQRRDVIVRARRGYAVEEPPPAVRNVTANRGAERPGAGLVTLDQIAERFAAGDARAFGEAWQGVRDARQMLRDYIARAPLWPATPRLEAALVLGLVEEALLGPDNNARDDALALLRRQHDLVRDPLGADEFECAWYRAEMALLQATSRPVDASVAIRQSLTRCVADPRLTLGLAVTSDRQWSNSRGTNRAAIMPEREVFTLFDAALNFPQTAAEAGVRSAFLAYRLGDLDEAARRLTLADAQPADGFVRHLRHLVRALVLQKQGQIDRGVEQFRAALVAWPGAKSARVGLMSALVILGARAEAEALSEAVQTAPNDQFDPFSAYWLGDYRAIQGIHMQLRELAR